ncbi:cyclic lactone autoinducer peptide [Caloranaerobacter ferrireducens]|nr:cyclic lactone autoinducer peptide [Caloranaerobacter ferrireducens]
MSKKFFRNLLTTTAAMLIIISNIGVKPTCIGWFYKPETPEILKSK